MVAEVAAEKKQKEFVHLSTLQFSHDSTKLKCTCLCAHCSFISSDSRRKGTKEDCYLQASYIGGVTDYDGDPLHQGFGMIHKDFALKGDLYFFDYEDNASIT